jgi:hypothetical protein
MRLTPNLIQLADIADPLDAAVKLSEMAGLANFALTIRR